MERDLEGDDDLALVVVEVERMGEVDLV